MSENHGALTCLECGEPISDGVRLVCSPRCSAVIRLVRYGRTHAEWSESDDPADEGRLNRYRREACILGRFPTSDAVRDVRFREKRRCRFPACSEDEVEFVDWRSDDPDLSRMVRAGDLRTLCADHQRAEAMRRFIGPLGQSARTAPAIWARMTAARPLVLRDDEALWDAPGNLPLLINWAVASAQTRRDLDAWVAALLAAPLASRTDQAGTEVEQDGIEAWMNKAFDGLRLPLRRRDRLVRAIHAWLLRPLADEVTRDALQGRLNEGVDAPPLGDNP